MDFFASILVVYYGISVTRKYPRPRGNNIMTYTHIFSLTNMNSKNSFIKEQSGV